MTRHSGRKRGFSLVELVVVIVIIGILAAIAIPRLSRGSQGASQSALSANLATVRNSISLYAAEHNSSFPGPDAAGFSDKLTKQTNAAGSTSPGAGERKYGPYVLAIPPCPVGENAGKATANKVLVDSANTPPKTNTAGGEGWVYNPTTGEFLPNTDQTDDTGKAFNTY
jgi:prepilin-type N-terminal cleavage/methylation domain-containing protein